MKIALVGAEFEENLAVRYLRGALEADGHDVVQLVFNAASDTDSVARQLVASEAPIAGFSMVFTARAREFATLAARARALGFRGHIIAGGHFAAFHARELLERIQAFDSIGCGEGEDILRALARHLGDPAQVPGLWWRRDGAIVTNQAAIKPPDLDALPIPPRKLPADTYVGLPITNLLGSRGCTHACSFCSIAAWHRMCGGDRLRLRAPGSVASEMASLYERGYRIFNFHDDNFILPRKADTLSRIDALGSELRARGVGRIAFAIKARPDGVDEEVFGKLRDLGLFRVFLGIEAGTSESLRNLGRGHDPNQNVRALSLLRELDIHTCFNLLIFNPESRLEDVSANVRFLRAHPHNAMNFCRTEVYAGTPLERRLREQGRLEGDFWGWDYRITDSRAQLAFELVYPIFRSRNYGDRGVHHGAMQVDYEHQILAHFFGATHELRTRAKEYLVEVNLDTCDFLDLILEQAGAGFASDAERQEFLVSVRAKVHRRNERLWKKGQRIVEDIRRAALGPSVKRSWVRTAAAASLVAASVMAAQGCKRTQATETVAVPVETDAGGAPPDAMTYPTEIAAEPPVQGEAAPVQDAGADAADAGDAAPKTHKSEMVPSPPPTTHMKEYAPRPPKAPTYPNEYAPKPSGKK